MVHVTVAPTGTVNVDGPKAKLAIETGRAFDGAVAVARVVGVVAVGVVMAGVVAGAVTGVVTPVAGGPAGLAPGVGATIVPG